MVAGVYGKKDYKNILTATCAGFIIELSIMLALITLVYLFPRQIFGFFTQDETVLTAIVGLINIVLLEVFVDVQPMNISAALNGQGDVKIPTIVQIISFLIVRISCCYLFAFTFSLGLRGLIYGLMCGGIASFTLNGCRLLYILRRYKKTAI